MEFVKNRVDCNMQSSQNSENMVYEDKSNTGAITMSWMPFEEYMFNAASHCWQKGHFEQLQAEGQHSTVVLLKFKM
jgi:hypothetical protein